MNATPRLMRLLAGDRPDRVPVVPFIGAAAACWAGVPVEQAYLDPRVQTDALAAAFEIAQPDAVFPFMDLTAEAEALGAGIRWRPGVGPEVSTALTADALAAALRKASPEAGRLPLFRETVSLLQRRLCSATAVGAYVPGPWTLVASALGLAQASRLMRREPEQADSLTGLAAAWARALMGRYADAGAAFIVVLEPCIAGGIMSPDDCRRSVVPRLALMVDSGRDLGLPVVLHVCGDANPILPVLGALECAGLSLDAPVDLPRAVAHLHPTTTIWGNLAPVTTLLQGTPDQVTDACRSCLTAMAHFPGHVLATGCEVPLATPPANLRAMVAGALPAA